MDIKQFTVPFDVKQTSSDGEFYTFEGYASVFGNIDLGRDIVEPGAFTKSLASNQKVKVLWQHKMHEPIGVPVEMREDQHGLFVKVRLPKDDTFVSGRVWPQVKIGSVDSMSIGYSIVEMREEVTKENGTIWHLDELRLHEFSLVSLPMNPLAELTDFKTIKMADLQNELDPKFLEDALRKACSNKVSKYIISLVKARSLRDAEERKQREVAELKAYSELEAKENESLDALEAALKSLN